jgi:hypothetical protein
MKGMTGNLAISHRFDPLSTMLAKYHPLDGTIEFYGRVNAVMKTTDIVLDLGAGRGSWYYDDGV